MADDSLNDDAGDRQHDKKVTYSLTFKRDQWFAFWQLLTVGCIMSDYLLENPVFAAIARRLSDELAHALDCSLGELCEPRNSVPWFAALTKATIIVVTTAWAAVCAFDSRVSQDSTPVVQIPLVSLS